MLRALDNNTKRSYIWPIKIRIRAAAKLQFLQTSTMPNPRISPNLTTLGRGNVPVTRNHPNQAISKIAQ
jgi:hypothetical protein